jgi:hypothetical protein
VSSLYKLGDVIYYPVPNIVWFWCYLGEPDEENEEMFWGFSVNYYFEGHVGFSRICNYPNDKEQVI